MHSAWPPADAISDLHGVGGFLDVRRQLLSLGCGEVAQYEVGRVHPAAWPTDAEAHPVGSRGSPAMR